VFHQNEALATHPKYESVLQDQLKKRYVVHFHISVAAPGVRGYLGKKNTTQRWQSIDGYIVSYLSL